MCERLAGMATGIVTDDPVRDTSWHWLCVSVLGLVDGKPLTSPGCWVIFKLSGGLVITYIYLHMCQMYISPWKNAN